jgi:hypothetical protein
MKSDFCVGNRRGAGTDADVFVTIFGEVRKFRGNFVTRLRTEIPDQEN